MSRLQLKESLSYKAEPFVVLVTVVIPLIFLAFGSYMENANASSGSKLLVNIGGQEYELDYTLTGATLISIEGDPETKTLRISIDAEDDGILTIELPKNVMDSSQNGIDRPFIVSVGEEGNHDGGKAVLTAEIFPPRDSRIVEVTFTKGTSEIQIIGTYLVPEFSSSSAIFMMIISTIIIGIMMVTKFFLGTKISKAPGGSNRQDL